MALNRRNVLIGLGTAVTGVGAAIGTGAFTTVEAERTVDVGVAGDSDAFLAFKVAGDVEIGGEAVPAGDPDYANIPADGTLTVHLDGTSQDVGGTGLNVGAITTISPLFSVTNNGPDPVGFYVDADASSDDVDVANGAIRNTVNDDGDAIEFTFLDHDDDASLVGSNNAVDVGSGNSTRVGLEIDTSGIENAGSDIVDDRLLDGIDVVADTDAHSE